MVGRGMVRAAALAALAAAGARAQNPEYAALNAVLRGVQFGDDPGPCPSKAKSCKGDMESVPNWVKAFSLELLWQQTTIGEAFPSGDFQLWDFTCRDISIDDLQVLQGAMSADGKRVPVDVVVDDLRMDCSGRIQFDDLKVRVPLVFWTYETTLSGTAQLVLVKRDMGGNGRGISVNLGTEWISGAGFEFSPPDAMSFRDGEAGCRVDISNGIDLRELDIRGLGRLAEGAIRLVLFTLFKGVIEGLMCDLFTQVAYIEDTGQKGGLNLWIEEQRDTLRRFRSEGLRDREDFEALEESLPNELKNVDVSRALDLGEDTLFEALSVGINDYLGTPSKEPGYEGQPAVNEVVDLLLQNDDGALSVSDIKSEFELDDYPTIKFWESLTRNTMWLKGFAFSGLNTFTKFQGLDNGYADPEAFGPRYKHTLLSSIEMTRLDLEFTFGLLLEPGNWVTDGGKRVEFEFTAGLELSGLVAQLASYQLLQVDPLLQLQLGQLVGEGRELREQLKCAVQGVDHFRVNGLQGAVDSLGEPRLINFFDLGPLVGRALDLSNTLFKPALANDLPYVMENYAKKLLNEVLDDQTFANPLPRCAPYEPLTYAGDLRFFNLSWGLELEPVRRVINELVGGDPIVANSVDINRLVEGALRYVIIERDGALNSDPDAVVTFSNPAPGTWRANEAIEFSLSAGDGVSPDDTLDLIVSGPVVTNLNSIWRLQLVSGAASDYQVDFNFNMGNGSLVSQSTGVPDDYRGLLTFELPVSIASVINGIPYADNEFAYQLALQLRFEGSLGLQVDKNELFLSKADNLINNLACALAVLESKSLEPLVVKLEDFVVGVVPKGRWREETLVGAAFKAWDEQLRSAESRESIEYAINYIITRIKNEAQSIFNKDFDPPYTRELCTEQTSPLNGTLFDSVDPLPLPNLTAISETLNDAIRRQDNPRGNDPAEWESLVVGEDDKVYDVTAENNEYVSVLSSFITPESAREALVQLGNTTVDPEFPSILDPLYQVFFLEEDESVTLRVDINTIANVNYEPEVDGIIPGLKLRFQELEITNVNQFAAVEAFRPYVSDNDELARFTTRNTVKFRNDKPLQLSFGAELEVAAELFSDSEPGEVLRDSVKVSLNLTGASLEMLVSAAVNETDLSGVQLGEVIFFNETTMGFGIRPDAFNCTIRRIMYDDGLFLPQFQAYVSEVIGPRIEVEGTILNAGGTEVINAVVRMLVDAFRKQVPNVTQGPIRDFINRVLRETLTTAKAVDSCTGVQYPDFEKTGSFYDFDRSGLPEYLRFLVNTDLLGTGQGNINRVMERFVDDTRFGEQVILNATRLLYNGLDLGRADVSVRDLLFEGLGEDSGGRVIALELLNNDPFPGEPHVTRSSFEMEGTFEVSGVLSYALDGLFVDPEAAAGGSGDNRRLLAAAGDSDAPPGLPEVPTRAVRNDLRIGAKLSNLRVSATAMTRVEIKAVLDLYAGNLLDLYYRPSNVPCLLAVLDNEGLELRNFTFVTDKLELTIRCEGTCDSPVFAPLQSVDQVTDNDVSEQLTEGINALVRAINGLAGQTDAQSYVDLAIATAREECQGIEFELVLPEQKPLTDAARTMGFLGVGMFVMMLAGAGFLVPLHVRRRRQVARLAVTRLGKGDPDQLRDYAPELLLVDRRLSAIGMHPAVPLFAKVAVPLTILTSTGLFLVANLWTVGVTVLLRFTIGGDETVPMPLLEFTLASSINDMWNAGTEALAIIIFVASGAWPHTKNMLLLLSWWLPPTVLSTERRSTLLRGLDALGKWSLIDAYVLIMLMVAFRFYISTNYVAGLAWLPDDVGVVDVLVKPGLSIYLFVLATIVSLLVNHYMLGQHERVVRLDEELEDRVNGLERPPRAANAKRALHRHVFLVPDERNLLYGFNAGAKLVAGALMFLALLLIAVGSALPLIEFEFRGVAGFAIGVLDPSLQVVTYSSLEIGTSIIQGIPVEDVAARVGVYFLQVIYLAFTFVVPVGLMVLFMVLWFVPLTTRDQQRLFFICEILYAWDALIVLLLSVVAALLQVSDLAQFIVQTATGSLCSALTEPLLFLGVPDEDALCFDVFTTILPSSAPLFAGMVLSLITSSVLFRFLGAAIADRTYKDRGHLDKHGVCPKSASLLLRRATRPVSRIREDGPATPPPPPGESFEVAANPAFMFAPPGSHSSAFSHATVDVDV